VEVKPDGIIYLPEIKYRRILNKAFGPGGWGLAPRGETIVTSKSVTREYALVAHGRYVISMLLIKDWNADVLADWSLLRAANKITSLPKAYPPRPKDANRMR
jgi:fructose-1,6-bisphosphatase/inositol monophosphatase family enzyme